MEWRVIPSLPTYEVNRLGDVRSLYSRFGLRRLPRPVKQRIDIDGYRIVHLSRDAKGIIKKVHRLVAEAFIGPCPEGMEVLHGPGGRDDNRVENLSYGTHKQNIADKLRDGTVLRGERHHRSKLNTKSVIEIRRRFALGETQTVLSREYKISQNQISAIVLRKNWAHVA